MSAGVVTTGLTELRAAVETLPRAIETALQQVAADTAMRVADRARHLVRVRSGYTHDQIVVVPDLKNRQYRIDVGPTASHPATRAHPANVPIYLEFGTRYESAHPFMRPSLDAESERYRRDCETASAASAEKVLR